jgi:branched-chain amino acid transport system permease protein
MFTNIGDIVASAIGLSGIYTLLGLTFVIIYRATRVLNLATGQFMALAAYVLFAATTQWQVPFPLAVLITLAALAVFASLSFHFFIRPLHGQPQFVVVVLTIGYSIVISGVISIIWGPQLHVLPMPVPNQVYTVLGARLSTYSIATVSVAAALVAALIIFFRFSRVGIRMRAAAELPVLASQSGINITILFVIAWALASVAAALAGISYGLTNVVSPFVAQVGLRGLTPALIGGFESIPGTILGAIVLAVVETLGVRALGGNSQNAVVGAVLLVFLLIKPTGIFGEAEVRRV